MIRYTTPTHELRVEGIDLSSADVLVTYKQGSTIQTFEPSSVVYDGTDTTITVTLTQAQSASFSAGSLSVQANWLMDGMRNATSVAHINVGTNLLEEEM